MAKGLALSIELRGRNWGQVTEALERLLRDVRDHEGGADQEAAAPNQEDWGYTLNYRGDPIPAFTPDDHIQAIRDEIADITSLLDEADGIENHPDHEGDWDRLADRLRDKLKGMWEHTREHVRKLEHMDDEA